jgi:predicted Zn-dependent protease
MPTEFGDSFDQNAVGREAMEGSDYERALKLFEELIRLSPHFKTLELLGECKLKIHQPSEAIVPLAASMGLGTDAFRAMYLLAQASLECGDKKLP